MNDLKERIILYAITDSLLSVLHEMFEYIQLKTRVWILSIEIINIWSFTILIFFVHLEKYFVTCLLLLWRRLYPLQYTLRNSFFRQHLLATTLHSHSSWRLLLILFRRNIAHKYFARNLYFISDLFFLFRFIFFFFLLASKHKIHYCSSCCDKYDLLMLIVKFFCFFNQRLWLLDGALDNFFSSIFAILSSYFCFVGD